MALTKDEMAQQQKQAQADLQKQANQMKQSGDATAAQKLNRLNLGPCIAAWNAAK